MFRGDVQLGQEVVLGLQCHDTNMVPVVPDSSPVIDVYAPGHVISAKKIPVMDRSGVKGYFQYGLFLDQKYTVGQCLVTYRWTTGAYQGYCEDTFMILPGGHPDGSVISLSWYHRPHANFLVAQLTSGKLVKGRNPTI